MSRDVSQQQQQALQPAQQSQGHRHMMLQRQPQETISEAEQENQHQPLMASQVEQQQQQHSVPAPQVTPQFAWEDQHAKFGYIMTGEAQKPYGLHLDLLVHHSGFLRNFFHNLVTGNPRQENEVLLACPLEEVDSDTFGLVQKWLYTGEVYNARINQQMPELDTLFKLWKAATILIIDNLQIQVVAMMIERVNLDQAMFSADWLINALYTAKIALHEGKDGGFRGVLIKWSATFVRTRKDEAERFLDGLSKEDIRDVTLVMASGAYEQKQKQKQNTVPIAAAAQPQESPENLLMPKRQSGLRRTSAKRRGSIAEIENLYEAKEDDDLPISKRRVTGKKAAERAELIGDDFGNKSEQEKEMVFVKIMLKKMLGPGYWRRVVKFFDEPVDPATDDVPGYRKKVTDPMDISTINTKFENGAYADAAAVEADFRKIFAAAYQYWEEGDPIHSQAKIFEEYFNQKWAEKEVWIEQMSA